ncbi:hypothetical protein HYDPIDRAFT_27727 [Hydnomerulius pinastri MD-312]|nr:hypothetical protein HYDPIDRAFT_27727 [Hydnomerulius pinastri MD-312]
MYIIAYTFSKSLHPVPANPLPTEQSPADPRAAWVEEASSGIGRCTSHRPATGQPQVYMGILAYTWYWPLYCSLTELRPTPELHDQISLCVVPADPPPTEQSLAAPRATWMEKSSSGIGRYTSCRPTTGRPQVYIGILAYAWYRPIYCSLTDLRPTPELHDQISLCAVPADSPPTEQPPADPRATWVEEP